MIYVSDQMISTKLTLDIDAADICERLVGIMPIYLQNFVSRGSYGLRASAKPGKVREQRRLFSQEDVFGIALAWLLFESGLRSEPLARVLNDLAGTKKANANLAAQKLLDQKSDYLFIARTPRKPAKTPAKKPAQSVKAIKRKQLAALLQQHVADNVLVISVGQKFEDIRKRMEILF